MTFTTREDQLTPDETLTFKSEDEALDWAATRFIGDRTQARLIEKKADREAQTLLELDSWEEPCMQSLSEMPITRPNWLIQGYIEHGSVGFLNGIFGSAKSFIALDWACCVATGMPWVTRDANKVREGNVIYVAAEGGVGISRRYTAWSKENQRAVHPEALHLVSSPVQLGYDISVDWLCKRIVNVEADFVIIDTLARSIDGLNENDSVDMAKVIAALYKMRDARGENMTTVLVVHHTGWGDQTRSRGSSRLPSDTDFSYTTTRGDDTKPFTLKCTKLKEDRLPDTFNFSLGVVAVEDEMTSCVIRPADQQGTSVGAPDRAEETDTQVQILVALKIQDGQSGRELTDVLGDRHQTTVNRALGTLKTQGKVSCTQEDGRTWRWYLAGSEQNEVSKLTRKKRK